MLGHERRWNGTGNHAGKHVSCNIHRDGGAVDKAVCTELFDDAFELTDIALDVFPKEVQNIIGKLDIHNLCLAFQNSDAQLRVRRLDIDDKSPFKTALNPFLQMLNVFRGTVGG